MTTLDFLRIIESLNKNVTRKESSDVSKAKKLLVRNHSDGGFRTCEISIKIKFAIHNKQQ